MIPPQAETRSLTKEDWLLLAETTFWLFVSRLAVLTLPFRWLMRTCGIQHALSPEDIPPEKIPVVERVTWAIDAVRWATPWDSNCLARAITGKRMLRKRGLLSTIYLGVNKSDPRTLEAHAWLRCGDRYITGVPGHENFTVVATFADIPAS